MASFRKYAPVVSLMRSGGDHWHPASRSYHAPALGEAILGVDRVQVVVDHELRAHIRRAFFAGLGQEDHVPIERRVVPLQRQHEHQAGDQVVFVVDGAPAVDVSAVPRGAKRRVRPLRGIDRDDVGVTHHENGPLLAVALDARHDVRALRVFREHLVRNAFLVEYLF